MAQQLFARRVSYLRSESLRKSCLFGFWFRYMRKAQHTHTHTVFGKWTASTMGGCPTPYFKTYFKTFPALMYAFDGLLCFWGSCWTGCHQDNLAGLVGGTANQPILTMRNQEFAMVCFKLSNVGKILENSFLSSGHSSPFFRSKHDFAQ